MKIKEGEASEADPMMEAFVEANSQHPRLKEFLEAPEAKPEEDAPDEEHRRYWSIHRTVREARHAADEKKRQEKGDNAKEKKKQKSKGRSAKK